MTTEKRMKPMKCPWCGTRPKLHTVITGWESAVVVYCKSRRCLVSPSTHPCDHLGNRRNREEAITAWNTRKP